MTTTVMLRRQNAPRYRAPRMGPRGRSGLASPAVLRMLGNYIGSGDFDDAYLGESGTGDPTKYAADTAAWRNCVAAALDNGLPIHGSGRHYYILPDELIGTRWNQGPTRNVYNGVTIHDGLKVYCNGTKVSPAPRTGAVSTEIQCLFGSAVNQVRTARIPYNESDPLSYNPDDPFTYRDAFTYPLNEVEFDGLIFDFEPSAFPGATTALKAAAATPLTYGLYASGVRNLTTNLHGINSAWPDIPDASRNRRGRLLWLDNVENWKFSLHLDHITQGAYVHYAYGVTGTAYMDGCVEALDFDSPCWDVLLRDLQAHNFNGPEAQVVDFGGGSRWVIIGAVGKNIGTYFQFYNKPFAHWTYDRYLAAGGTDVPITEARASEILVPESISVSHVRINNPGRAGDGALLPNHGTLMAGLYRQSDTWTEANQGSWTNTLAEGLEDLVGLRDLTIEDWEQNGGGQINVNDCERFTMDRFALIDVECEDSDDDVTRNAALTVRIANANNANKAITRATGAITNGKIIRPSGMGFSLTSPGDYTIDKIKIEDWNQANSANAHEAYVTRRLGHKPGVITLGEISIRGGQSADDDCILLNGIEVPEVEDPDLPYRDDHRVVFKGPLNIKPANGADYLRLSGPVAEHWCGPKLHGVLTGWNTVTGNVNIRLDIGNQDRIAIIGGWVQPLRPITSYHASNYTRVAVRKTIASWDPGTPGVGLTTITFANVDNVARAAREVIWFVEDTWANQIQILEPGEALQLTLAQVGAGSTVPADPTTGWNELAWTINYLPFTSV